MMKSFVLGLVFYLIRLTESHLINCVSKRYGKFDNFLVNDRYLWTVTTDDVKRCASECLKDEKCVAFFYSVTGECRTHSVAMSVHSDIVPTPNWIYYVTCRGKGYIGTGCTTNNECTTANSECRDDVCKCIPGYSFHEQLRTCSATCDNYGGGYTETKHHFIMGFNALTMYGVDFDTCYEACVTATGFTCKTFEYRFTSGACYLQPATKLDAGDGNWRDSDIDFHYQMDCI